MLPAAGLALLLVVTVWGSVDVMDPGGTGAANLFSAIDGMAGSKSADIITAGYVYSQQMTSASKVLTVAAAPAHADADQIMANASAEESGGTVVATIAAPNDPTQDEQDAMQLMPSFGFSVSSQWTCLYDLWNQESSWNVYAKNAYSGAYGIPQSDPGSKMATFGADWATDPITQIKWGLNYIKQTYGTPCVAWTNEVDYHSY